LQVAAFIGGDQQAGDRALEDTGNAYLNKATKQIQSLCTLKGQALRLAQFGEELVSDGAGKLWHQMQGQIR